MLHRVPAKFNAWPGELHHGQGGFRLHHHAAAAGLRRVLDRQRGDSAQPPPRRHPRWRGVAATPFRENSASGHRWGWGFYYG